MNANSMYKQKQLLLSGRADDLIVMYSQAKIVRWGGN